MIEDDIKYITNEAKAIKSSLNIKSASLQNYIQYQKQEVQQTKPFITSIRKCCSRAVLVDKQLRDALRKMSKQDKAKFYLMNLKIIKELEDQVQINEREQKSEKNSREGDISYQNINARVFIKYAKKQSSWNEATINIYSKQNIIKVQQNKLQIDLKVCYIRFSRSKKQKSLILYPIKKYVQMRIKSFPNNQNQTYEAILKAWKKGQKQKIQNMMFSKKLKPVHKSEKQVQNLFQNFKKTSSRVSEINAMQSLKQSLKQNQSINPSLISQIPQTIIDGLFEHTNFRQKSSGIYYHNNNKTIRKIIYFPIQVPFSLLLSIIDSPIHTKRRLQNLNKIQVLEHKKDKDKNISINYQIHKYKKYDIQYLYKRHYEDRNSIYYFLDQTIDFQQLNLRKNKKAIQANISYCIWRVMHTNGQLQLLVQAQIDYSNKDINCQEAAIQYIGQFNQYISKRCFPESILDIQSIDTDDFQNQYLSELSQPDQDEFVTALGSLQSSNFKDRSNKKSGKIQNQEVYIQDISIMQQQVQDLGRNADILHHHYLNTPQKKGEPLYIEQKGFPLLGQEWIFDNQGYMVNTNKQKIQAQSNVLKYILQGMGKNFLTGKSILNMSLPIQVFGTQSNLQILAKRYMYAPRFLQKAAIQDNPLQRLKIASCMHITNIITQVKMQKPFNPILGQTYQGIVDGCPLYGQQISHHPPISSVYMVGRGYKIYGNFQAKVSIGLNTATGCNEGWNHIIFDNYAGEIKMNTSHAELHGLIYGARKCNMIKKSHVIDEQNRLFLQMKWGKNKNDSNEMKNNVDYFTGKIVRLKKGTDFTKYEKIKSNNIQAQYGELYGRIGKGVFYNGNMIYSSQNDLPYQIIDCQPCLQSDCSKRQDLIMRKLNDYQKGQQQKQRLEQIQRRDRKLRAQYSK